MNVNVDEILKKLGIDESFTGDWYANKDGKRIGDSFDYDDIRSFVYEVLNEAI